MGDRPVPDIQESRPTGNCKKKGYVRYKNLPLESRSGHRVEVEFVSNVYARTITKSFNATSVTSPNATRLQRQVQEQAAALADLDRRKDEILALLSHDTSQPLPPSSMPHFSCACTATGIVCSASRPGNPPIGQHHWAAGRATGTIVDELLEASASLPAGFSFTRNGSPWASSWKMRSATVRSLIDQCRHELTVRFRRKRFGLHAQDAARLEQVVVNLLTNAAKYTDQAVTSG